MKTMDYFNANVDLDMLEIIAKSVQNNLLLGLDRRNETKVITCFLIAELPSDYVMTFGASDAFATSEYALLEGKEVPQLNEVFTSLALRTRLQGQRPI